MDDTELTDREDVREIVRERYGAAARFVLEGRGQASCCCGPVGPSAADGSCCAPTGDKDPITTGLYSDKEAAEIPEDALLASLGCGNPTALAALNRGEIVLDLGSGGGIDVLLSAKRVGPNGFAYGLDMTDEMLAVAERNRADAGAENVKFLKGHIEEIPLPDNSVDVIISNCVINLSGDKDNVLREAFRVLKPGGRFAVSDIVWRREIPGEVRTSAQLWAGCIGGALLETEYRDKLAAAGFGNITVTPTRVYTAADAEGFLGSETCGSAEARAVLTQAANAMMSAFIRAEKPTE
ncbi:MAG: arsenite methyltransferase [Armatimonadetes bacterium]|nr:arsenite methyltransferase [Armatimonadota bacterium]